ncbi:MAG: hypothetical protein ACJZ7A_02870, partial [Opitutales bacterium]
MRKALSPHCNSKRVSGLIETENGFTASSRDPCVIVTTTKIKGGSGSTRGVGGEDPVGVGAVVVVTRSVGNGACGVIV